MDELLKLYPEDVKQRIDPKQVRLAKVLCAALTLGPLVFLAVVLFIPIGAIPMEQGDTELSREVLWLMLGMLGILTLAEGVFLVFLPTFVLAPVRLLPRAKRALDPGKGQFKDPVAWMLSLHRLVLVMRAGILEGLSLFGVVVLFLARQTGFIQSDPLLWLSLVPLLILVVYQVATFPSSDSMAEFLTTRILKPLQRAAESQAR
jgi:hypothetical protein